MVSIQHSLQKVKDDLPQLIEEHLDQALREVPDFIWRDRLFNPLFTLVLFIMQVMHGNTAITHLPHLSGMQFSATAYCKARLRLPLKLIESITHSISQALAKACDPQTQRWRGHRVWHADGSSFSMPDTPALQEHFGQPHGQKPGCGFPVATLLMLTNAAGMIMKTIALPLNAHEAGHLHQLHKHMHKSDVLVYDRASCSFTHLANLIHWKLHGIVRMHQRQHVNFRTGRKHAAMYPGNKRKGKPRSQWIKRLGPSDQLVYWFKPRDQPKWMQKEDFDALPGALKLRELRYQVSQRGFRSRSVTLVTTLLDEQKYPASELAEQYLGRWQIEVDLRHLKQTMKMDVLKCQGVEGVLKELSVFVLVYNLVRLVMLRAAERQKVLVNRISFIDALRWLRDARESKELIDLLINPRREGRVDPRVVKRRPKQYKLMNRPREELRKTPAKKRLAA